MIIQQDWIDLLRRLLETQGVALSEDGAAIVLGGLAPVIARAAVRQCANAGELWIRRRPEKL